MFIACIGESKDQKFSNKILDCLSGNNISARYSYLNEDKIVISNDRPPIIPGILTIDFHEPSLSPDKRFILHSHRSGIDYSLCNNKTKWVASFIDEEDMYKTDFLIITEIIPRIKSFYAYMDDRKYTYLPACFIKRFFAKSNYLGCMGCYALDLREKLGQIICTSFDLENIPGLRDLSVPKYIIFPNNMATIFRLSEKNEIHYEKYHITYNDDDDDDSSDVTDPSPSPVVKEPVTV